MRSSWPFEKHFPGILSFHALSRCGVHWKIQSKLRTTLETTSITIAACRGLIKVLVIVIRKRKRQMETFVNVNVAKVLISHVSEISSIL